MYKVRADDNLHHEQSPRNLVPGFSIHLRGAVPDVYLVLGRGPGDLSTEIVLLAGPPVEKTSGRALLSIGVS
jgi:hypothetical protein